MNKTIEWKLIGDQSDPSGFPVTIPTEFGPIELRFDTLTGGRSQGVQVLQIDTGRSKTAILPTRGMSIWKCWSSETEFGWQSPIEGPVHPLWVPITDPNGLGWLEGFDEFLVRCGLESFGAPVFDERGLKHPLHGRIGNLPAHSLTVSVDPVSGKIDVHGWVSESRFLVRSLSLHVHMQFRAGLPGFQIVDTVTNQSSKPTSMQLLYHINVGQPILDAGATVAVPIRTLCPRNLQSAKAIDRWSVYQGPTDGFEEEVYFSEVIGDAQGWTAALITDSGGEQGLAVRFDTRTLPYFNLWKNTAAVEDGYVTGLEPATGFPNQRTFEESQGRVLVMAGGESRSFRLHLEPIVHSGRIQEVQQAIAAAQVQPMQISSQPDPRWCQM